MVTIYTKFDIGQDVYDPAREIVVRVNKITVLNNGEEYYSVFNVDGAEKYKAKGRDLIEIVSFISNSCEDCVFLHSYQERFYSEALEGYFVYENATCKRYSSELINLVDVDELIFERLNECKEKEGYTKINEMIFNSSLEAKYSVLAHTSDGEKRMTFFTEEEEGNSEDITEIDRSDFFESDWKVSAQELEENKVSVDFGSESFTFSLVPVFSVGDKVVVKNKDDGRVYEIDKVLLGCKGESVVIKYDIVSYHPERVSLCRTRDQLVRYEPGE